MTPDDAFLLLRVGEWFSRESELLDNRQEAEWLNMMVDKSISYRVPLRQTTRRKSGTGFIEGAYHLDETWGSLNTRVARLATDYAWGDDPPARIRHFVTNIRIEPRTSLDQHLTVRSNVLLSRSRADMANPVLLTCERVDVLAEVESGFRLVSRTVLLDVSVLETPNLAVIF